LILSLSILSLWANNHNQASKVLRVTCPRRDSNTALVYYFSKPSQQTQSYPMVIMCDGSSSKRDLRSALFIHQYFDKTIDALNYGLITVEKWGIDGNAINEKEFWSHYSRSQRFYDHLDVIKHLESGPPEGWDGTIIFIGVSEGGPLVNQLSIIYPKTRATVNWVGAGDWDWADEFWEFWEQLKKNNFLIRLYDLLPRWMPFASDIPQTRQEYDQLVEHIKQNPLPDKWLGGMTYFYHADAFQQKRIDYKKIYAPMLVVAGAQDSIIVSCDEFVAKAKAAGAPITYLRVEDMDHWIRKRPDVIKKSFEWLRENI